MRHPKQFGTHLREGGGQMPKSAFGGMANPIHRTGAGNLHFDGPRRPFAGAAHIHRRTRPHGGFDWRMSK